jgi:hypothetical protein
VTATRVSGDDLSSVAGASWASALSTTTTTVHPMASIKRLRVCVGAHRLHSGVTAINRLYVQSTASYP